MTKQPREKGKQKSKKPKHGAYVDEFSLNFSKRLFGRHEWSYYDIPPEQMLAIFEDPLDEKGR